MNGFEESGMYPHMVDNYQSYCHEIATGKYPESLFSTFILKN
jgi:hypothetical protein